MIRRGRIPFTVLGLVATAIALIFVGAKKVSGTQTGGRGARGEGRTDEGQEPRDQEEPSNPGRGDELQVGSGKGQHHPTGSSSPGSLR
jgi:hypothetical protein